MLRWFDVEEQIYWSLRVSVDCRHANSIVWLQYSCIITPRGRETVVIIIIILVMIIVISWTRNVRKIKTTRHELCVYIYIYIDRRVVEWIQLITVKLQLLKYTLNSQWNTIIIILSDVNLLYFQFVICLHYLQKNNGFVFLSLFISIFITTCSISRNLP